MSNQHGNNKHKHKQHGENRSKPAGAFRCYTSIYTYQTFMYMLRAIVEGRRGVRKSNTKFIAFRFSDFQLEHIFFFIYGSIDSVSGQFVCVPMYEE